MYQGCFGNMASEPKGNEMITSHERLVRMRKSFERNRSVLTEDYKYFTTPDVPALCGPFGEETPGEWQTLEDVAYNWIHLNKGYSKRGTLNRRSWHDFHAKRD